MKRAFLILTTFVFILFTAALFKTRVVLAASASFDFSPATGNYTQGCKNEIVVNINPGIDHSNAADIEIHYDPTKIEVFDSKPTQPGTQVGSGDAYETLVFNNVDALTGTIRVAAGSFISELTSTQTFLKIEFKGKPGVISAGFTIYFTGVGDTLDSNIAESTSNLDLLTTVTNGNYTFNTGISCIPHITTTPTPTPVHTVAPSPTPTITTLPKTGETPTPVITATPCPAIEQLNEECRQILEDQKIKEQFVNVPSSNAFILKLGQFNSLIPGIGTLALLSLFLLIQTGFSLYYLIGLLLKNKKRVENYTGIVFNLDNGAVLDSGKVTLFDLLNKELAHTETDLFGRYYFEQPAGDYHIRIQVQFFENYLGTINISGDHKLNYHNLKYLDNNARYKFYAKTFNRVFIRESLMFTLLAFICALLAVIIMPALITLIILILNLVMLIISLTLRIYASIKLGI